MGKINSRLDDKLVSWIERQHVFFTATAPTQGGHVNCSPKGLVGLRILDPLTVAYLDLTGSGAETIAHLRDNGRIVLMFCAFAGPPRILRLHGQGEVVQAGDAQFQELLAHFLPLEAQVLASARAIIRVSLDRIADSCGYGVPTMRYEGERPQLGAWVDNRLKRFGADGLSQYQIENNTTSLDGLPGLELSTNSSDQR
jgi:hypothetical protein